MGHDMIVDDRRGDNGALLLQRLNSNTRQGVIVDTTIFTGHATNLLEIGAIHFGKRHMRWGKLAVFHYFKALACLYFDIAIDFGHFFNGFVFIEYRVTIGDNAAACHHP